jgi:hypothetical protein
MTPHVGGTTLGGGLDQRPGAKGIHVAGKFGLDPHRLDDEALERELRHLYATREETFFHGTRQALLTTPTACCSWSVSTPAGSRSGPGPMRCGPARAPGCGRGSREAGRPWRNVEASLVPMRYRRRIVPVGNRPDAPAFWDRSTS